MVRTFAMVALGTALMIAATGFAMAEDSDPYLWLEDIHGATPLAWVKKQNAAAAKTLKADPAYGDDYDTLLALMDAADRIPYGTLHGGEVYNFWQDADHVRGIWRRTTIASYESKTPQWQTLLDIDALAAKDGKDWVFKGVTCTADRKRCLVSLSPHGGDAVVVREFDTESRQFVAGGFALPDAKSDVAYDGRDEVLVGTDFGPGTLTDSGYPRIVKAWHRGTPLSAAKTVYEGTKDDVGVSPFVAQGPGGITVPMLVRSVSFFESEYFFVRPDGSTVKLPLPRSADLKDVMVEPEDKGGTQVLATLRNAWTLPDGKTIAQGALIAFPLDDFLATGAMPKIAVLYTPGPRDSINQVASGRDALYVAIYENVKGTVHAFTRDASGAWHERTLDLPKGGSTSIASVNAFGPEAYFTYEGFLTPTTLYADHGTGARPEPIKALPARFDAAPYKATQYEAVSKDGTKIPYFLVRAKDARGPAPTILYGYGGFEDSLTPWYWSSVGRLWLAKGGAFAVANIRGGGEFGLAWHEAALKTHRQKAFDDFIAVAEDIEHRKFATPKTLGIMGGSNGGLLVGAVTMERPRLFGAVVCQVPLLDMLRYTKIGAGASWIGEYGDPNNPKDRAAILKYSPYQNVHPWVHYPPMFFVTATSDDRVTPVHARKMAAKMEAQGHDVLFFENTDGGHAAAANHAQAAEMWAMTFVYLAKHLGLGE